ncbi:MAG: 23S rRNA (adenine(2503)-C(2))-methyltransferase RlmN [Proteobacteria bacterium]|nr:MAG: 23S rRNA (adenine(2503)-C(2))-methyltransferase RlmN [Pseudomonadota bacterium]
MPAIGAKDTETRIPITGLTFEMLSEELAKLGKEKYRSEQVFFWLYRRRVASFAEMTNVSKDVRALLEEKFYIPRMPRVNYQVSKEDNAQKSLFRLSDNRTLETVLMPIKDRLTQCVSSQVGCAMACAFCNTGDMGLMRNLKTHEIVDQVLEVARAYPPEIVEKFGERITNIVYMGMGEPLHNINNVLDSIAILTHPHGFSISHRKITVSTSGLVPQMLELGRRSKVNLAVSLNATTDELRDEIMPVNKRYKLKDLLDGCRQYELGPGRRITFEYVMLQGLNDSRSDADRILKLLRGIPAKVNLIPYNPHPASPFKRPNLPDVLAFQKYLLDRNMTTTVRISKGPDILAACGQLRSSEALKSKYAEKRAREEAARAGAQA